MKKTKDRLTTALLIIIFLAGLSLVLYPSVANYWNSMHQSKAISHYSDAIASISEEDYSAYLEAAQDYNSRIRERNNIFALSDAEMAEYNSLLNITGDGIIGYIEIPFIEVTLPIYHGTSEEVLQVAAGHLDWTAFPIGGEGTHAVISGHRGLPSAKLFTDLDKLMLGDVFMIRVLDEYFTYEVDQILIVSPQEVQPLQPVEGKEYCTLVTCTPYGINTHRLLIRGHRIENIEQAIAMQVTTEAVQIEPILVTVVVGIPTLLLMLIITFIIAGGKKKNELPDIKEL